MENPNIKKVSQNKHVRLPLNETIANIWLNSAQWADELFRWVVFARPSS